jgi:hypothetical protein
MLKRVVPAIISILFLALFSPAAQAPIQETPNSEGIPLFDLVPAPLAVISANIDSNSPAFWQFVQGRNRLHIVTSWWTPSISRGFSVNRLRTGTPVKFLNSDAGGKWMEAILQDESGTLYGYYHNEPMGLCPGSKKTAPRIGAARSTDNGASWDDLGIILDGGTFLDCSTPNEYFAGGIGDFTVILDGQKTDAYFFFTIYTGDKSRQGVAIGRMSWAQRDTPRGNVTVWDGQGWRFSLWNTVQIRRGPYAPRPIYAAEVSWHDPSGTVDSFWGPSVHWNAFLNQYVMLLNRASDSAWSQEGVYIAFSSVLDDPSKWTKPLKIVDGGPHYPQVIGLERDMGTDKLAGWKARLFLRGQSDSYIVFRKPD